MSDILVAEGVGGDGELVSPALAVAGEVDAFDRAVWEGAAFYQD